MARHAELDDYDLSVRGGRTSAADFIEQFEEGEGAPSGRKKGGGGGQRKEPFGYGKRAQKKRRKVVVEQSQERRREELVEELLSTLPSSEEGRAAYKAWLERALGGGKLVLGYEVQAWPISGTGPGGQHMQKKRTSVRLEHTPTGIAAESHGRSQKASKRLAMLTLTERLEELSGKWELYMESYGGKVEDLLPVEEE